MPPRRGGDAGVAAGGGSPACGLAACGCWATAGGAEGADGFPLTAAAGGTAGEAPAGGRLMVGGRGGADSWGPGPAAGGGVSRMVVSAGDAGVVPAASAGLTGGGAVGGATPEPLAADGCVTGWLVPFVAAAEPCCAAVPVWEKRSPAPAHKAIRMQNRVAAMDFSVILGNSTG